MLSMLSGALDEVRVTNESTCKFFSAMTIGRKVFKKYFGESRIMGSTLARCSNAVRHTKNLENQKSRIKVLTLLNVLECSWTVCLLF